MALFMVFNLWIGPGFFSLVVNFLFFNSHFSATTLGLDLFSGAYHDELLYLRCSVIRITQCKKFTKVDFSFTENGNRADFQNVVPLKKIRLHN